MKKFIITEEDKKHIGRLYGLPVKKVLLENTTLKKKLTKVLKDLIIQKPIKSVDNAVKKTYDFFGEIIDEPTYNKINKAIETDDIESLADSEVKILLKAVKSDSTILNKLYDEFINSIGDFGEEEFMKALKFDVDNGMPIEDAIKRSVGTENEEFYDLFVDKIKKSYDELAGTTVTKVTDTVTQLSPKLKESLKWLQNSLDDMEKELEKFLRPVDVDDFIHRIDYMEHYGETLDEIYDDITKKALSSKKNEFINYLKNKNLLLDGLLSLENKILDTIRKRGKFAGLTDALMSRYRKWLGKTNLTQEVKDVLFADLSDRISLILKKL